MKQLKHMVIAVLALVISGCVMLSSGPVETKVVGGTPSGKKEVTFLNDTPYMAEMSIALAEQGFTVKGMSTQHEVTLTNGPVSTRFDAASASWGITLLAADVEMPCAFTEHRVYNFTMMLTDIRRNNVAMVFKQKGSDGPCSTIKPVFSTLAQSLSDSWK